MSSFRIFFIFFALVLVLLWFVSHPAQPEITLFVVSAYDNKKGRNVYAWNLKASGDTLGTILIMRLVA